ncbi:MAG: hypothetical protein ACREEV_03655 [Dongiaceae bacterium]
MRTTARLAILLAAAIVGGPAAAHESETVQAPVDCEDAPADAILELPAPAGYWMRILCTDTGHTLVPVSGDAWQIHQDARWTGIPAATGASSGPNDWYFVAAAVRETTGEDDTWAQGLFARRAGFPVPGDVRGTHAVDLTDNRGNMNRIYIFSDEDGPIAGIACLRSCANTVTVTVTHPEVVTPSE